MNVEGYEVLDLGTGARNLSYTIFNTEYTGANTVNVRVIMNCEAREEVFLTTVKQPNTDGLHHERRNGHALSIDYESRDDVLLTDVTQV